MPEVQNVGAIDYAQYQPSQTQQYDNYSEDYNTQPEVYNYAADEVKAANNAKITAAAVTALVVGGLAFWGGHAMGSKGTKTNKEAASKAIEQYNKLLDEAKKVEKMAEEGNEKWWGDAMRCGKEFVEKVKNIFKDFEKIAEDAGEAVEKAADDVAKEAA